MRLPGSKIRNRARLLDFLDEYGVPVPPDPTELVRHIQEAQPNRFVRLVARPGWHANQFLLGDKTVGQGKERLRLDGSLNVHLASVRNEGSLSELRSLTSVLRVRIFCSGSLSGLRRRYCS